MFSLNNTNILTTITVGSLKIFELPVKAQYNLLFTWKSLYWHAVLTVI